jgi:hypothetical protein
LHCNRLHNRFNRQGKAFAEEQCRGAGFFVNLMKLLILFMDCNAYLFGRNKQQAHMNL